MLRRFLLRTSAVAVRQLSTKTAVLTEAPLISEGTVSKTTSSTLTSSGGGKDSLGRRLFSMVYRKRSAAVAIRKWKEEGHIVHKPELNRIVRELRRLKRYKHALEVCEWILKQQDMPLVSGDYAITLDLIAKLRGLNSAEEFFENLPNQMRNAATYTALLHTYVQHKKSDKAEALLKKMSESGFLICSLPYNEMLSLYMSTGQLEKVPVMIKELKKTTSPDVVTYNIWLSACASQNFLEIAEKVFLELKKAEIEPDWVTYSTLASIYIKNSRKEEAVSTLKEMEKRISRKIRIAYSSLISLHTGIGNKDDVQGIWKKMKSTYRKLNDAEYKCMINSLLKLKEIEEAEKLYNEWESVSPTKDSRVPNLLLATYINNNQMEIAESFYKRMVKKDIVPGYTTWELLTYGYSKQEQLEKAIDCFKNAVLSVKKWDPDEKLVQEVFTVVEEFGDIEAAEQLLVILRDVGYVNTEVYNFLLKTYAKAGKMPLIVEERMEKDNALIDEETKRLIQLTSKMCVGEIPKGL